MPHVIAQRCASLRASYNPSVDGRHVEEKAMGCMRKIAVEKLTYAHSTLWRLRMVHPVLAQILCSTSPLSDSSLNVLMKLRAQKQVFHKVIRLAASRLETFCLILGFRISCGLPVCVFGVYLCLFVDNRPFQFRTSLNLNVKTCHRAWHAHNIVLSCAVLGAIGLSKCDE